MRIDHAERVAVEDDAPAGGEDPSRADRVTPRLIGVSAPWSDSEGNADRGVFVWRQDANETIGVTFELKQVEVAILEEWDRSQVRDCANA